MNLHRNLVMFLTNETDIQNAAKRGDVTAQKLCAAFVLIRDSNMRGCTTESDVRLFNDASAAYWGTGAYHHAS